MTAQLLGSWTEQKEQLVMYSAWVVCCASCYKVGQNMYSFIECRLYPLAIIAGLQQASTKAYLKLQTYVVNLSFIYAIACMCHVCLHSVVCPDVMQPGRLMLAYVRVLAAILTCVLPTLAL